MSWGRKRSHHQQIQNHLSSPQWDSEHSSSFATVFNALKCCSFWPHIVRFLVCFHGLGDVLHPLDGAPDIRVFDDGRLVGDTGGGGITCRRISRESLESFLKWLHLQWDFTKVWCLLGVSDVGSCIRTGLSLFYITVCVSTASPEISEMSMSVGNSLFWRISWLGRFMVEKNIMLGMVSMKTWGSGTHTRPVNHRRQHRGHMCSKCTG